MRTVFNENLERKSEPLRCRRVPYHQGSLTKDISGIQILKLLFTCFFSIDLL